MIIDIALGILLAVGILWAIAQIKVKLSSPSAPPERVTTTSNSGAAAAAVAKGIGEGLLRTDSLEATRLIEFLKQTYSERRGQTAETPEELGLAYLECMASRSENPDTEFAKRFTSLSDATRPAS